MTFFLVGKWLKANWGWLWRVAAALCVLVALWYVVATVVKWHDSHERLPQVEAQAAKDLEAAFAKYAALEASYVAAYEASKGLQSELDQLAKQRTAARPAPVIRVCKPTSVPGIRAVGRTDAGLNEASTSNGPVQEELGLDTGPLYREADAADELSAQVRALQDFIQRTR